MTMRETTRMVFLGFKLCQESLSILILAVVLISTGTAQANQADAWVEYLFGAPPWRPLEDPLPDGVGVLDWTWGETLPSCSLSAREFAPIATEVVRRFFAMLEPKQFREELGFDSAGCLAPVFHYREFWNGTLLPRCCPRHYAGKCRSLCVRYLARIPSGIISQSPTSGPPGTTYHQWGAGFTPDTTATVHLKKPDGREETPWNQPIDSSGRFEVNYTAPWDQPLGTYTWWVIDGSTGAKSNELSYDVARNSRSTLAGQVFDEKATTPLAGATVKVSGKSATTDESGSYSISNLWDGACAVKASKKGYSPVTEEVYIAPSSSTRKDFWLSPANPNTITVTGVTSRYGGQVYFLEGFDQSATFTATVDWAGHPARVVRFTTSTGVRSGRNGQYRIAFD